MSLPLGNVDEGPYINASADDFQPCETPRNSAKSGFPAARRSQITDFAELLAKLQQEFMESTEMCFMRFVLVALICSVVLFTEGLADEVRVSHCFSGDSISAINDRQEPTDSHHQPRHSFWAHRGTKEWAEYHFDSARTISSTSIYWLDDSPTGDCPVPKSWRLFYREPGEADFWLPVENPSEFGVKRHVFNRVTFQPLTTRALRIEVQSREGWGSGIIEWDVRDDRKIDAGRQLASLEHELNNNRQARLEPLDTGPIRLMMQSGHFSTQGHRYLDRLKALADQKPIDLKRYETDPKLLLDPKTFDQAMLQLKQNRGVVEPLLRDELSRLSPIVYFTRQPLNRCNAANCHIWQSTPKGWGCSIRVYDPRNPTGPDRILFEDSAGSIFDMSLSWDATTIFFTMRRQDEPCWQVYEMPSSGGTPRKISRDPNVHDVAPVELPDGRLVFVSTRREGYTLCQPGPTSNLYIMNRDGTEVRCVSQNTLSDFSPQILNDGRVLFTRWEYIDRDLTYRQSLWTQNPDGRGYQLFFGNTNRQVGTFWQARPVPGHRNLVVSTFAPHHHLPYGAIGLIENHLGIESERDTAYCWLTPEFPVIQDRANPFGFRDPYPTTDYLYLCSYGQQVERKDRFGLFLLDLCGNRTLIREDPSTHCYGPMPLAARSRPMVLPDETHPSDADYVPSDPVDLSRERWATMMVADVYRGVEDMIPRGTVHSIRIMEQIRKKVDLSHRAFDQSPVMSYATYYAKRCWGEVPVESDGSAHFQLPALREVYFQLVDAEGRELHRQTTAVQAMPGETRSCIGCHEPRNESSSTGFDGVPIAATRNADRPKFPAFAPDGVIDFCTVVQPVLDRYCVECHTGADASGGYDLTGDKTRFFNMAYDNLLGVSRSYRQHDMFTGNMLSDEQARGKPLVHFYWLLRTPSAVSRPYQSGSHASRLPDYLDQTHCGHEIPSIDRRRVTTWIDANVPYYGTYDNSRRYSAGYRDLYTDPNTKQVADWYINDFHEVYHRRCDECHGPIPEPNDHSRIWDGRFSWINLTRPEQSPALTAHLAKEAGGRGLGVKQNGQGQPLFKTLDDPDHQKMLHAIRQGSELLKAYPRVDCETH